MCRYYGDIERLRAVTRSVMAIVKSGNGKKKIASLAGDDIRRMFKRSLDDFLKENEDDIGEPPTKNDQSEILDDLVSLWQDTVEMLVDTAVDQYCSVLIGPPDDDDEEADSDGSDEAETDEE